MGKTHNFYAGPSILPQSTIEETAKAVKNFAGTGLSVMEVSGYHVCMMNVPNLYNKVCEPLERLLKSDECQITNIPARMNEKNDAMMQWLMEHAAEN